MKNFKFTIRGNIYEVDIKKMEDNQAKIEVNGTVYNVELNKEQSSAKTPILRRPAIKHAAGSDKISKSSSAIFKVKAPLPGNILQVFVKQGDNIKKGDKILQYEAMKMENDVLSDKDGIIESIKVSIGDAILQDDILVEIKPN
jgi:biotin carboxyl carrier protein